MSKIITNEELLEKINKLEEKLEETNKILIKELDKLNKLEEIHKNTQRMEDHINFIESTYERVKTPFHYLMDKINLIPFKTKEEKKEITN